MSLKRLLPSLRWPLAIGACALLLTLLSWRLQRDAEITAESVRFRAEAAHALEDLQHLLGQCNVVVQSAAAFAASSDTLSWSAWSRLAQQLDIGSQASCTNAVIWSPLLTPKELPAHVQAIRDAGFPAYTVKPPGLREAYTPGAMMAPDSPTSRRYLGTDSWYDPMRRATLEKARDSAGLVMTEPMMLQVSTGQAPVTFRYAAVYRAGAAVTETAQRRAALRGYVSAPLRLDVLVGRVQASHPDLSVRVQDGAVNQIVISAPSASPSAPIPPTTPTTPKAMLQHETQLPLAGRLWTVRLQALPSFSQVHGWLPSHWVLLAGLLLTALSSGLAAVLTQSGERAQRLARRYSAEARNEQARLKAVLEGARDGILTLTLEGRFLSLNRAAQEILGRDEASLLNRLAADILPLEQQAEVTRRWQAFLQAASGQADAHLPSHELDLVHRDGSIRRVRSSLSLTRSERGATVVWLIGDLTHEREMERQARLAQQLSQQVFDLVPLGIMVIEQRKVVSCNHAAEEMLGYAPGALIGVDMWALHEEEEVLARCKTLTEQTGALVTPGPDMFRSKPGPDGRLMESEWTCVRKDGTEFPCALLVVPMLDPERGTTRSLRVMIDITERKRAAARIERLALHDHLTDLPNRVLLAERALGAIARAAREHKGLAVMMLDLDHFKQINDTLGHAIGDELLSRIAQRLRDRVRGGDTVARMGGDEFALLLGDIETREQALALANSLLACVGEEVELPTQVLQVTPSIGIAMYPDDGDALPTLLRHADTAMYRAKQEGRNSVQFFHTSMNEALPDRMAMERELRHAIERRQLLLHYQPLVDARSGRIGGVEALLRWQHPERGMVSPAEFIPLAEERGLIIDIGRWVLHQACQDIAQLRQNGWPGLRVAVNLSPRQFRRHDITTSVREALDEANLPGDALELEITEGVLMESVEHSLPALHALRALGATVAVDDFGTGFSSLAYLLRFPVTTLKVDRTFVRDIGSGDNAGVIAATILQMAQGLGLHVVAEGVEMPVQRDFLVKRGCDTLQGFLFSRPVPLAALAGAAEQVSRGMALPAVKLAEANADNASP